MITAAKLRPEQVRQVRVDAFMNTLTGRGDPTRDKRLGAVVGLARRFTYMELDNWYEGDAIFAKLVDDLPDEMTRAWIDVRTDKGADVATKVLRDLRRLGARAKYTEALRAARHHGGAVVVLGVDDGQAADKPLNRQAIAGVRFLLVLDRWQITPTVDLLITDPATGKVGEPEFYDIHYGTQGGLGGKRVHHSRIHRFDGIKLSERASRKNNGWGDSVGVRLYNAIQNYHAVHDNSAMIVEDFSTTIYKLKGLAEELMGSNDEDGNEDTLDALKTRLVQSDVIRSIARAMVLDEDETFEKLSTQVTGLDKLIEAAERRLVTESGMPHTRLLGESPGSSLGEAGGAQDRQWYDHVAARQDATLLPPLEDLVELVMLAKQGPTGGAVPPAWSVEFKPLWQMDAKEQAEIELLHAEADEKRIRSGSLYPDEVAESRHGGDRYGTTIVLDRKLRREQAEALDDEGYDDDPEPPEDDDEADPAEE